MSGGRIAGAALALSLAVQAATAAAEEPDGAVTLRVMSFNVWYGGDQVSLADSTTMPLRQKDFGHGGTVARSMTEKIKGRLREKMPLRFLRDDS